MTEGPAAVPSPVPAVPASVPSPVPASDVAPGPLAGPVTKVRARWIALISLANLGLFVGYYGPLEVLLPNQVQDIAGSKHKVAELGWVTGAGAAAAMIAQPVVGALSDRAVSRFGRRHPWTVCGALAAAAALALLAGQHTIAGVIICWCVAQAGLNAMQASLTAAVPDHVPVRQRGLASGWISLQQTFGVVVAVALVSLLVTGNGGYVLVAVLVAAFAAPFVLFTRSAALARERRPPFAWREFARSFWVSPRRYPDFA
jgi:MFS family permease